MEVYLTVVARIHNKPSCLDMTVPVNSCYFLYIIQLSGLSLSFSSIHLLTDFGHWQPSIISYITQREQHLHIPTIRDRAIVGLISYLWAATPYINIDGLTHCGK